MRMVRLKDGWRGKGEALVFACLVAGMLLLALGDAGKCPAQAAGSAKHGKIITALNLQNADMNSVLSFLADYGGVNIVAGPTVKASVTLSLQEVTWRQALDILLQTYSLAGIEEKGYIRVLPTDEFLKEQAAIEKHRLDQSQMVPLETAVIPVKYGTAKDMIKSMRSVISSRGTIDTDDRTNSLVIRDTPDFIEKVKSLAETLDKETNQVKISAQLLEVESGALTELGLNWSMISRKSAQLLDGDKSEAQFSQATNLVSDPAANYTFATVQGDFDIEGIKQFDESGNVVITFEEVGTILRVIPHITSENRILLKLNPERSSYTFDANGVIINTNNAETNVVVENGQTAVIGGLTTQLETKNHVGLPILKDIPVLGYLFRYTRKEVTSRDLVIFVTPTIVTDEMHGMNPVPQSDQKLSRQ
jgi:type II secretory pathway component HofQ